MSRPVYTCAATAAVATFLAASISGCQAAPAATEEAAGTTTVAASGPQAPVFEVDPFWPKPLPNHWVTGSTIGLSVDAQGNVWTIHRGGTVEDNFKAADIMVGDARSQDEETKLGLPDVPVFKGPIGRCCKVAPPVLVYAPDGKLLKSWGGPGPGYDWPESNHGITVDHQGNVWIAGNGAKDSQILKFNGDGKFLMQIGKPGMNGGSNDTANFKRPTKIWVDPKDNEVYVSDGYDNRRVIVFDANTGAYKRHWGAYGARPSDEPMPPYNPNAPPSKQFSTVHCVIVSNDGFVYVCDRVNDRIQVFEKSGKFVREARIDPHTFRSGAVWDMTFSHDPEQKYIYAANGVDEKINVLLRSTLEVLTTFGDGGRYPGQFFGVHNVATDAQGNLYTAETYTGARVQKFIFKGIRSVPADQGVPWPEAARGN